MWRNQNGVRKNEIQIISATENTKTKFILFDVFDFTWSIWYDAIWSEYSITVENVGVRPYDSFI